MKTTYANWIRRVLSGGAIVSGLLLLGGVSRANPPVTIEYDLAGDVYTYSIFNNLPGVLDDFVIYFPEVSDLTGDVLNYTLNSTVDPAGWSSTLLQPSAINLGGMVEWSGGSIAPGASKGGFSVDFSYTGSATLGSQYFEVYDNSWNLVDSGHTQKHQHIGVPDTGSSLLYLTLAMVGLAIRSLPTSRLLRRN